MTNHADPILRLFAERCEMMAQRVRAGNLRLIDAADMLQSAAEFSGLQELVGDDEVQKIMAEAFTRWRS